LLRETGLLAKGAAAGWVTVAITPVTITANYRYWLMGISDVGMISNVQGVGHITQYYNLGVAAVQTPMPGSPGPGNSFDGNNDIAIVGCD
jgi:hypothetical protein